MFSRILEFWERGGGGGGEIPDIIFYPFLGRFVSKPS